jgi:tetrahydromethanopterin S-methyltransferase subunit B
MNFYNKLITYIRNRKYEKAKCSVNKLKESIKELETTVDNYINAHKSYINSINESI